MLVVAGATGALGNALVQRCAGVQRYATIHVLAGSAIREGFRGVRILVGRPTDGEASPGPIQADVGLILFDPPRMFHEREKALWTPAPADLVSTARWMRDSGVHTLAIVMPHEQGRLPAALRHGLANLDEQGVAAVGFERLLIVRAARKPGAMSAALSRPQRLAHWILGALAYLVPNSERPVRAGKVAEFIDLALAELVDQKLAGTWVAPPELLWQAAQRPVRPLVRQWLGLVASTPV